MKQNVIMQIQAQLHSFSKVGKRIAQYILDDPGRVIQFNIRQFAREVSVSEASIVRFCRAINLDGFSDLKIQLLTCVSSQKITTIFEEIDETDSMETVVHNVFVRNLITLQTALELIDYSAITAAADLIREAKSIVVIGLGTSASIAENFHMHLFRAGLPSSAQIDAELMQVSAHMAAEDTVFIAISKGGRTEAVVKALEEARTHGAKTISITAYDKTPMTDVSDVPIIHYAPSQAMVSTRIVQNTIADCLYICATRHRQQAVVEQIKENRRVAEFLRIR